MVGGDDKEGGQEGRLQRKGPECNEMGTVAKTYPTAYRKAKAKRRTPPRSSPLIRPSVSSPSAFDLDLDLDLPAPSGG